MKHLSKIEAIAGVDYNKSYADNMGIQNLGADPASPVVGQVYFNTAVKRLKVYTGISWTSLDAYITDIAGSSTINVSVVNGVGTITLIQSGVDHTQISNKGSNTHAQIDSHIADSTQHFTQSQIDHNNIINKGVNTHSAIDSHIADTTKHFLINDSGNASNEVWSASKVKAYCDTLKVGLDWQDSVIATQNTPPTTPTDKMRYRVGDSPTGAWASFANYLTEYDGETSTWVFTLSEGMCFYDENADALYLYTGSAWSPFGTATHNNLGGLQGGTTDEYNHLTNVELGQLHSLTSGTNQSSLHIHDDRYSLLNHNHSGVYSEVAHNHSGVYSEVGHTHNGVYAKIASFDNAANGGTEQFVHSLGYKNCLIQVIENSTGKQVIIDTECVDTSRAKVYFPSANVSIGQYKVLISSVV